MLNQIESQPGKNNKPVGSIPSGTGGEGEDNTLGSPKGVQLSAVCPTVISAGGEADVFDSGEGLDGEGCIVKASMTGLSEIARMRRPSVFV